MSSGGRLAQGADSVWLLPAPQVVTGLKVADGIAAQLLSGQLSAAEAAVMDPDLLASAAIRKQVRS